MTDPISCPVVDCPYESSINDVVTHVTESSNPDHTWESLGYETSDKFRLDTHLKLATQWENQGTEKHDFGDFETAVEYLEHALWHYQQAKLVTTNSKAAIGDKCSSVLSRISEIETDEQIQEVDTLLDEAEFTAAEVPPSLPDGDPESAAEAYERSITMLERALTKAETVAPDRIPEIQRQLRRVRMLRNSLGLSGRHRELREFANQARTHASLGDRAFKQDDFETAVDQYTIASQYYDSIEEIFRELSFDEPINDPTVCDVCRDRFDGELGYWGLDLDSRLQVCPSCAQFGSEGTLPTPTEAREEHRIVEENIKSICEGDTGVDWTAFPQQPSTTNKEDGSRNQRDTQQMLIQLTGTVQQIGRLPTAEDLDEHTDFGFLEYRDEFGSILNALEEAGFEVSGSG